MLISHLTLTGFHMLSGRHFFHYIQSLTRMNSIDSDISSIFWTSATHELIARN